MTQQDKDLEGLLPLTPIVFHVLLALSEGPRHGYALMQEVNQRGEGRVGLGPGTLYGAIQRMEDAGFLRETDPPEGTTRERRRRFYEMTDLGRRALLAEAAHLESLAAEAHRRNLSSRPTG